MAELGVARCSAKGDREGHLGVSTDLAWDLALLGFVRSRAEVVWGGSMGGLQAGLPAGPPSVEFFLHLPWDLGRVGRRMVNLLS